MGTQKPSLPSRKHRRRKTVRRHAYDLLVVRVHPDGEIGLSRPCADCALFMYMAGIRHVYYTTNDGDIAKERVDQIILDGALGVGRMSRGTTETMRVLCAATPECVK